METGSTTTPVQSPLTRYLIAAGLSAVAAVISGLAYYFWPAGLASPPTPAPSVTPTALVEQPEVESPQLPAQPAAKTVYVTRATPQVVAPLPAPTPVQKARPTVTSDAWQAAEDEFNALLGDTK